MQNISESISDKIIDLLSDSDKYSLKNGIPMVLSNLQKIC